MLTIVAVLLVLLAFADIVSGIFTTRFVERLRAELFETIEEQRQVFRQLKQVKSDLKSAAERRETAQHKCDELQERRSRALTRISTLAELAEKRRGVKVRGRRPD